MPNILRWKKLPTDKGTLYESILNYYKIMIHSDI